MQFIWQPCGHSGICKGCAGDIFLCPTCQEIVDGARDSKLVPQLAPLALGSAFNCSIDPEVDEKSGRSNPCPRPSGNGMEIFGGQEADLSSNSEDTTEDETEFLHTVSTTVLNKPKRLLASTCSPKEVVQEPVLDNLLEKELDEGQAIDTSLCGEGSIERVEPIIIQPVLEPTQTDHTNVESCEENGRAGPTDSNVEPTGSPLEGGQDDQGDPKEVQPSRGKRKNPISFAPPRSTRMKSQAVKTKEVMKLLADISPPSSSGGASSGRLRGGKDRV